ncbi:MAG: DNA (cytosine-5-)-methyltransferase, partial [Desulfovibrio sp.]|nr:DNA (cytosine-5-)-methyltransferase [Desulfovibrio sp.]
MAEGTGGEGPEVPGRGEGRRSVTLRYLSLCSGIEAASVAWRPLGWEAVAFSEIEAFPCAVLAHHYPDVPNLGDMTKVRNWSKYRGAVDLVVAGTPCQDFSIAGKRAGMARERSGLALEFVRILAEVRPRWIVWENVPGIFSTNGGRDFGTFIGALDDCGYSCAWRVLAAQFFGVPQRR